MHLYDLKFPVYAISKTYKRIWEDLNVTYIETESGTYVLDNKNIEGDSLGSRRLKINNSKLYIPRKVYYNITQLLHSKYTKFIDTNGTIFSWKKQTYVPLKYYYVKSIIKDDISCIIHIKGINFPQRVNCRLAHGIKYVGVLHTDNGYILYEYSEVEKQNTRRKI